MMGGCVAEHERPEAGGPVGCSVVSPGDFPTPNCDPSDNTCPSTGGTCNIDQAKCGDPSTCLPLADNSKKVQYDFRLRRLLITSPPSLVGSAVGTGLIQSSIIDKGVDLSAPECGEISGTGAFNWLLRLDPTQTRRRPAARPPRPTRSRKATASTATSSGASTSSPRRSASRSTARFTTSPISLLNVPIFVNPDAGASDPSNVIILPLRNAILNRRRSRRTTTASAATTSKRWTRAARRRPLVVQQVEHGRHARRDHHPRGLGQRHGEPAQRDPLRDPHGHAARPDDARLRARRKRPHRGERRLLLDVEPGRATARTASGSPRRLRRRP